MSIPTLETSADLAANDHLTVPKSREKLGRRTLSSIDTQGESRNSSEKVWAEDYCEFDFGIEGEAAKGDDEYCQQPKSNSTEKALPPTPSQRSFASLLPSFRTSAKSPPHSPTKHTPTEEEAPMPTFTGDTGGSSAEKNRFSSWFTGSSAPILLAVPAIDSASSPTDPQLLTPSSKSTMASRLNLFASPKTSTKTMDTLLPVDLLNDELFNIDIEKTLCLGGKDTQGPLSPAAFNELLMNAEGILLKALTGYKLRTVALHEMAADQETMKEELDNARSRAEVFKLQMEGMMHQFSEKDETIAKLKRELALEKQARKEEQEAREKSIALIRQNSERASVSRLSIDTRVDEDLGISSMPPQKSTWRRSGNTIATDGDSDVESGVDSVFSRSLSPALTSESFTPSANLPLAGTEFSATDIAKMNAMNALLPSARPKAVQQKSTFKKILGGIKASPTADPYNGLGTAGEGCSNCRGQGASVAWDTVGLMRAENKGLKERVGELESAVDGALDLVYGI